MAAPKKPAKTNQSSVKRQKQATAGLESAFATRTAGLEETDKLYERANKKLESQLATQNLINASLKEANNLNKTQKKGVETLAKMWGQFESIQAKYARDVKDGIMTQEQANKKLKEQRVGYDRLLASLKLTGKENKAVLKVLQDMGLEMKSVEKAFEKTNKKAQVLNAAMDQLGSSGIPMMRELGDIIKNIGDRDLKGLTLALTGAGAALAVLANNYLRPEAKATAEAENNRKQIRIDGLAEIAKIEQKHLFVNRKIENEINQNSIDKTNTVNRLNIDAQYASQKAAIQFNTTMMNSAAEFRAASKTAFFGKGLGSVGYGAAQLQLAGVSAEQIASSLSAASNAMGKRVSSELAADMAVMSKRTGQSAENLASVTEYFMRTDKVGAKSAINMQEGLRAMADSANVDLGGVMEEVAQASKEALGYQIKSGPALAKQVVYAKSLGVSFNDIAKAGKSMVLNYKDSIKNEMQLSAMLGRNVNLSEARSLFAQGKNDEALKSIQAQGLDPAKMNMFQQEALQQALGGLDLNSIQKISQNQGRTGGNLKQVNANAANKGYLATNTSAQASLTSEQANISAKQAIVDAKLSADITAAYLKSPGYKTYQDALIAQEARVAKIAQNEAATFANSAAAIAQLASTAKLAIERTVTENWQSAVAGAGGAIVGNLFGKYIEKKFGGGVQDVRIVGSGTDSNSAVDDVIDAVTKNKKTPGALPPKIPASQIKNLRKVASSPLLKTLYKGGKYLKGASKVLGIVGSVASAGYDFYDRKNQGQSNLQAGAGVGGGLAGAALGAKGGAMAGAAIGALFGGVGAVPGALIGGLLGGAGGYFLGSSAADYVTGANAPKKSASVVKKPGETPGKTVVPGAVGAAGMASATPQSLVLSDVQYQTRLQMKMVELLGTNAILLQSILEETDKDKSIKLNGVKLNSQLMLNARKQMAVSRKEAVGTNASM
jgi:hypothetical protein